MYREQEVSCVCARIRRKCESWFCIFVQLKNSVLSLLKCDPYLQEEFLMFFDDERPPESRLHGDYEEIMWSDDLIKVKKTEH